MSSSDISVRGNAFTWQRKFWIIFSPSWNGEKRRKRKQQGCLDCKQEFSKFPTKHCSSAETRCRQKSWLFLSFLSSSKHQNKPLMLVPGVLFQSMSKKHQLISIKTVFNILISCKCSTFNSSVQPHEVSTASNNSTRMVILPKLVTFRRDCQSKAVFQYAKGKNKL